MTHSRAQGDRNIENSSALSRRRFLSQSGIAAVTAASAITVVRQTLAESPAAAGPMTTESGTIAAIPSFQGTPKQIGIEHGKRFASHIEKNLAILVVRDDIPRQAHDFKSWVKTQERIIGQHWPWYIEEMHGVAEGSGKRYEDVLLLNLRAWNVILDKVYERACLPTHGCSSLAVTLADGRVACAGAIDDVPDYYCGPVRIVPDAGHRFISFPMVGTGWGERGMNDAGLSVGISSVGLPGLKWLDNATMADVAVRAMLQTCATVGDAREFCRQHPFTYNLVCVDAQGGIFCANNTAAGLLELPANGCCALTNHIVDDEHIAWLGKRGMTDTAPCATTRPRRGNLLQFLRARQGKCSPEDVRNFVGTRDDTNLGTIHNSGSIILTYACPQASPETFWIMQPKVPQNSDRFQAYRV